MIMKFNKLSETLHEWRSQIRWMLPRAATRGLSLAKSCTTLFLLHYFAAVYVCYVFTFL